jgi:nucleolar GTP-binding protein
MNPQELLDSAYSFASKQAGRKAIKAKNSLLKKQRKEQILVKEMAGKITDYLKKQSKKIPSIEKLDPFTKEMVSSIERPEKLKKASSQLLKSIKVIKKIQIESSKKIFKARDEGRVSKTRNQFIARTNSVLKSLKGSLKAIELFEKNRRKLPVIDLENPVIVLAGYPNTGKTTILSRITKSKPKIAHYPFTTQNLNMGKMNYRFFELQILDTPGLLDREKEKMNEIEKKALAALKYIASVILFVIDASKTSGYAFEKQIHLLKETKKAFPKIPLIVLLNKTDIAEKKEILERKKELKKMKLHLIETGKGTEKKLVKKLNKEFDGLKLEFN